MTDKIALLQADYNIIFIIILLQPMPGKHSLLAQLDRYSKEFIIARMKLLHIFLNRMVNHPILSCDKNFHVFLTAKPAVSSFEVE